MEKGRIAKSEKPVKIGLSGRGLNAKAGGVKQYIKHIYANLISKATAKGHAVYVFYDDAKLVGTYAKQGAVEVVLPGYQNFRNPVTRFIWDYITLPVALLRHGIDVSFYPKSNIPYFTKSKSVVVVHDLAYFFQGINAYTWHETIFTKVFTPSSVRRADAVIAVSKRTREDIYSLFRGVADDKVKVIYEDASFKPESHNQTTDVRQKYGIGKGPYIFMSSELSPRKNLPRALEALAAIKDQIPHKFVMTGGKGWKVKNIAQKVKDLGLEDRFQKIGYVEDEDMAAVYAEADVYFHPSVYEGFGLTLLEAMYANTPVCYSHITSHPEVVGDAGLGFDPYDIKDMSAKLLKICTDDQLKKDLVQKGTERIKLFSWESASSQTLELILSLADK